MKRVILSIAFAVGVYLIAGALLLVIGILPGNGPSTNVFENPFGFSSIFVAVAAIATGLWTYWRLEPNRLARAQERRRLKLTR